MIAAARRRARTPSRRSGCSPPPGPRCAERPGAYAAVVELVREGYLCHYGEPRLLGRLDPDLRLLAGDHLYARGIERLARLGDLLAVDELSDLISLAAQLDAAAEPAPRTPERCAWLAATVAIAAGADARLRAPPRALLRETGDADPLWRAAREAADRSGAFRPPVRGRRSSRIRGPEPWLNQAKTRRPARPAKAVPMSSHR